MPTDAHARAHTSLFNIFTPGRRRRTGPLCVRVSCVCVCCNPPLVLSVVAVFKPIPTHTYRFTETLCGLSLLLCAVRI